MCGAGRSDVTVIVPASGASKVSAPAEARATAFSLAMRWRAAATDGPSTAEPSEKRRSGASATRQRRSSIRSADAASAGTTRPSRPTVNRVSATPCEVSAHPALPRAGSSPAAMNVLPTVTVSAATAGAARRAVNANARTRDLTMTQHRKRGPGRKTKNVML